LRRIAGIRSSAVVRARHARRPGVDVKPIAREPIGATELSDRPAAEGCANEKPQWDVRGDEPASRLRHHHRALIAGSVRLDDATSN